MRIYLLQICSFNSFHDWKVVIFQFCPYCSSQRTVYVFIDIRITFYLLLVFVCNIKHLFHIEGKYLSKDTLQCIKNAFIIYSTQSKFYFRPTSSGRLGIERFWNSRQISPVFFNRFFREFCC